VSGQATEIAAFAGMAIWKRKRIKQMLGEAKHFSSGKAAAGHAAKIGGAVACWASRFPVDLVPACARLQVPVWQVEDGFIRSTGLGAGLVQPCSIVLDRAGIYYDPSRPSDLENLLQSKSFRDDEKDRAGRLIARLVSESITKYNLKGDDVDLPQGRKLVLVPGQVEGDRSVLLGGCGIKTMSELLRRVRRLEPDSFIIYKPHPDVVAGLRDAGLAVDTCADLVTPNADLLDLIDRVDVVHTLTSLAGFEAVLRKCEVVVHGQPFYAGWGLTHDLAPMPRRTRRLTLEEMTAAALIDYPVYADLETGASCTVEHLIDQLSVAGPTGGKQGGLLARSAAWLAAQKAGGNIGDEC
jgi:capsule polysaccharide export protein KpsC/LpsZ